MPYCRKCGKEIAADDKFCIDCGTPTKGQTARSPSPTAPQQSHAPQQQPPPPPTYQQQPPPPPTYQQQPPPPPTYQQQYPPQQYYQPPPPPPPKTNWILVVVGYIFAFLGGLIGMIIGIYLSTRPGSGNKMHGGVIFLLAMIMFIIWISIL